jgi:hypothetical protein
MRFHVVRALVGVLDLDLAPVQVKVEVLVLAKLEVYVVKDHVLMDPNRLSSLTSSWIFSSPF